MQWSIDLEYVYEKIIKNKGLFYSYFKSTVYDLNFVKNIVYSIQSL